MGFLLYCMVSDDSYPSGEHSIMCTVAQSLCCEAKIHITMCVKYIQIKK